MNRVHAHMVVFGMWFISRCLSVFILSRNFLIRLSTFFSFSETVDGLRPGLYFFTLGIFLSL